ncbi:Calycin-like protein [Gonapodya prolifera JEL478]|uniref:Calycin-like protein n=1 Tax=Gonapodya prolifera (strain JEL478) TaxID=1344416 RepID=A0A139AGC8_GONPJ|nr:Calycin-like protein [Gonapodya prolifera JEL478]|eukprot:KXS15614.1 Calycin-like protein [Gonapodya prolifera JEL478]
MAIAASLLLLCLLATLGSALPTSPLQSRAASDPAVNPAVFDGTCYYPTPDPNFPEDLTEYTGRWYQVAGTPQIFTAGCTCIYAEYGIVRNGGAISVKNECQLPFGIRNSIEGEATPVSQVYGKKGTLQVKFSIVPGGGVTCPGPNYVIQKYDKRYAIVQSPMWGGLFILSREQHPASSEVDTWIAEAGRLGTNVALVSKISQDNCKFT